MSKTTPLRREAIDRECQIRLPGCEGAPCCLCHFRMSGISGMGMKSPDAIGAWACSACHSYVDTRHDAETKLALAEGVFRTLAQLIREGVVKCS